MSEQLSIFSPPAPGSFRFYLGTHHPNWLSISQVPLFVSRRTLMQYATMQPPRGSRPPPPLPRASAPWALDSGGFTELQMFGEWRISSVEYVRVVRRFNEEIGRLEWAAPQDWMCEPIVINGGVVKARVRGGAIVFAGTKLSVAEHQRRTIDNFLQLRDLAPEIPWAPVIQGWAVADYWRHVDDYGRAGVDLATEAVVGVGSVCRRQATTTAYLIFSSLADAGLRLHGFGVKSAGLNLFANRLTSADSLAWSDYWKRRPPLAGHDKPGPGRPRGHRNCANCLEAAHLSLESMLTGLPS